MKPYFLRVFFVLWGFSFAAYAEEMKMPASIASGEANIFVYPAQVAIPSVVNISTLARPRRVNPQEQLFRQFFEDFFQGQGRALPGPRAPIEPGDAPAEALALGTGFVIDERGLILTNNHVVQGADEIQVKFTEEKNEVFTSGKVVGRDPDLDLALIQVSTKRKLKALVLGDSDQVKIGEYVMAIGNPFAQGHSATKGIISQKGRASPDFALANYLQTDAPINPGNSGGPLVNLKGEVIGINNAIDQRAQGIGFAIPINMVKSVLPQLRTKGSVSRGYIGIQAADLSPEIARKLAYPAGLKGCLVGNVSSVGPAGIAGLEPGDVITQIGVKPIYDSRDLIDVVSTTPIGETVQVDFLRGKKKKTVPLTIAERPDPAAAAKQRAQEARKNPSGIEVSLVGHGAGAQLVITAIEFNSPGDRARLSQGDVILKVDQKSVRDPKIFYRTVSRKGEHLLFVAHSGGGIFNEVSETVVLKIP